MDQLGWLLDDEAFLRFAQPLGRASRDTGVPRPRPLSHQTCVDRVQQSGAGKRFFEERYAALQHFAFGYELTCVA
jgi:hypothetical protein